MSTIYFFRHGQAGLRDDYDNLSATGTLQAQALGRYLAERNLPFGRVIVGGLKRQHLTLKEVRAAYSGAGLDFPEPETDPGWNEFDLDGVFAAIVPLMLADDPEFKRQWEEMLAITQDSSHDAHHEWLPCDSAVVLAWREGRYAFEGESWPGFIERIRRNFAKLVASATDGDIAVFTSAIPIAITMSATLGFDPNHALRLGATALNSNISTIWINGGEPFLAGFNGVPHLPDPALHTLR